MCEIGLFLMPAIFSILSRPAIEKWEKGVSLFFCQQLHRFSHPEQHLTDKRCVIYEIIIDKN